MVALNDGPGSPAVGQSQSYSALPTGEGDRGSPLIPSQSSPTLNRPESPAYLTPLGMSDGPRASYLQPEGSLYGMDRRDSSYAGSLSSEAAMGGMGVAGGRNSWGSNLALNPNNGTNSPRAGVERSPLSNQDLYDHTPPTSPDPSYTPNANTAFPSRSTQRSRSQMNILPAGTNLGWREGSDDIDEDREGKEANEGARLGGGNEKKPAWWPGAGAGLEDPRRKRRRWWLWGIVGLVVLIAIAVGAGLGVHFSRNNASGGGASSSSSNNNNSSSGNGSKSGGSSTSTGAPKATATTGFANSLVTLSNGSSVTYVNPHGGNWAYDPSNPYLLTARPNNWSKPLSEAWDWSDTIHGVNLGGWFVLEPFIVPSLFETYANNTGVTAIDEYTLSLNMGKDLESVLTNHYETFITEVDIMQIAAAGLTWVRVPIGYWALETWENNDEPYLAGVAWKYIVQLFGWCKKYGIRINLDLHGVPGSQNGWNHSGRLGQLNWMNGVMGLANMQRSMNYIRTLTEFIMQPEWQNVVGIWGILNEPQASVVGQTQLGAFYLHMHDTIRNVTGYGAGNGPIISLHEGFIGYSKWDKFLQGSGTGPDRLMLDIHQYTVFELQLNQPIDQLSNIPCQWWAASVNDTMNQFGLYNTGEWSLAINDCGHWVNGVGQGQRYDGTYNGAGGGDPVGSCDVWNDSDLWNSSVIAAMHNTWQAGVDALQSNFFWTWNIGSSTLFNYQPNPMWSYRHLLQKGVIGNDPRAANGYCAVSGGNTATTSFTGYQAFMTGGVGAGTVPAAQSASYTWPLTAMGPMNSNAPTYNKAQLSSLPQYTPTAKPVSASRATATALATSWPGKLVASDTQSAYTAIATCTYPDIYSAVNMAIPTAACGAGAFQRSA